MTIGPHPAAAHKRKPKAAFALKQWPSRKGWAENRPRLSPDEVGRYLGKPNVTQPRSLRDRISKPVTDHPFGLPSTPAGVVAPFDIMFLGYSSATRPRDPRLFYLTASRSIPGHSRDIPAAVSCFASSYLFLRLIPHLRYCGATQGSSTWAYSISIPVGIF